jgi:DNA polymerase-1
MPQQKRLVIIDAQALIHRAFHALPETLTNPQGEPTNALYGFASVFLKMLGELQPDYLIAAFDRPEPTFRHKKFKAYKIHRPKTPQNLESQIPKVKELLQIFAVPVLEVPGFEADDIIGTLVKQASQKKNLQILVVSGDLDTLQLVNKQTQTYTLKRGITDTITYGPKEIKERYGLEPKKLPDFKGLVGDPSDNIPGVSGIGPKTASSLLAKYGSLKGVYRALEQGKITGRAATALKGKYEEALFSKELATIRLDVPIKFDLKKAVWGGYNKSRIKSFFQKQGFRSLLARLPGAGIGPEKKLEHRKIKPKLIKTAQDLEQVLASIPKGSPLFLAAERHHLSFALKFPKVFYFSLDQREITDRFLDFILKRNIEISGWNLKKFLRLVLLKRGKSLPKIKWDAQIMAWLLNPESSSPNLTPYLTYQLYYPEDAPESVKQLAQVLGSMERLQAELKGRKLFKIYQKIELCLIPVLAQMEHQGIRVNFKKLKQEGRRLAKKIKLIEKKALQAAGCQINLSSPKQLRELLFERFKIPVKGIAKTPGGELSTDETELQKISKSHPMVPLILKYRELTKLKTTYFDALPRFVQADNRIHTQFLQTGTATGRLASRQPNLQNIPARGPWALKIRSAFEAPAGWLLMSFDFSQVELRLAAHLSDDPLLLKGFNKGEDIHRITASQVFGVELNEVSPAMRHRAKVANFGVLYGLSAHGLSQSLQVPYDEAKEFIKNYFDKFQGLATWIEKTKQEARRKGYVRNLFGRRRPLPFLKIGDWRSRAAAEREAVNFPIQGGVADLMKLAMIKIQHKVLNKIQDTRYKIQVENSLFESKAGTDPAKLKENSLFWGLSPQSSQNQSPPAEDIHLLLQIHDELIFEVKKEAVKKYQAEILKIMEGIYPLKVPLKVESSIGRTWAEF